MWAGVKRSLATELDTREGESYKIRKNGKIFGVGFIIIMGTWYLVLST